jgi:hypothetical protein
MSNHFSADNLKFPGDDARLDLTDLFVFKSSDHPDTTVLIIDVNPFMTAPAFHPDAVYRINIDTDGDIHADVAFSFTFSPFDDDTQTGTAYYATGPDADRPEPAGEVLTSSVPVGFDALARPVQGGPVRLFAGVRSDPFFADAEGALHGFQWTGVDTFAGKNILSIALEVPDDMLGAGPGIGVWATTSRRRREEPLQLPAPGRRRGQLPRTVVQTPGRQRVPGRRGSGGGPQGTTRHPPLRPHHARRLPQRPRPHRRRLQHAIRLGDARQSDLRRPQATRRPAGRVPLPRRAESLKIRHER